MEVSRTHHKKQPMRLVASDLDGTLLRPDGTVSKRTCVVLQNIQQAGIAIVLVSARPPRILRKIAQAVCVTGLAICCNGAIVYDLDQEAIIQHIPILPELAAYLSCMLVLLTIGG